jgi:hypothetical protein
MSIPIEQHPSLQSAQVGKLEPIAHLLGKLAGDPELTFGFVPSRSVCGDETGGLEQADDRLHQGVDAPIAVKQQE